MMRMFRSATLQLTAWYLAILMAISITFSVVIYQLNYHEVSSRLENLQHSLIEQMGYVVSGQLYGYGPGSPFSTESQKAGVQMALSLIYINGVVFVAGGLGSYFLARRTLRPIEEAHEAQSRFTSDASHELRTPLAAMKSELEVTLRDTNLSLDEAKEILESNLEEVDNLIQLSEMLLKLSRLEHGTLEVTQVDFSQLFQEVVKRYPKQARRFEFTTRKKAVTYANEAGIVEVMSVLVDNAIKYSPPKSKINVRIFERYGSLGFEIKNSGPAIPPAVLSKVFDRFYRGDTSRTNGAKNGYGLGLSIAKKIVDIHHGELTASSTKAGTTFTFFIPVIRKAQAMLGLGLAEGKITTK